LPLLKNGEPPVEIEQGYLPGERLVERVRRIASEEGVELARTVKEGSGITRLEVEEPVTPEVFDKLWQLTEGRRLRERRYRVPEGDLTWEIDEFLDRDLVLEVELSPDGPPRSSCRRGSGRTWSGRSRGRRRTAISSWRGNPHRSPRRLQANAVTLRAPLTFSREGCPGRTQSLHH
jgi:CYTH domain-containing protein